MHHAFVVGYAVFKGNRGPADILDRTPEAYQLVSDDLKSLATPRADRHEWFDSEDQLPGSYEDRLALLVASSPDFYDLSCDPAAIAPEVVAPLLCQPVVEVLLQIPSYVHFTSGRDRGLARLAFRDEVPADILRRQWKDRAPGFAEELVLTNMPFLRENLLDGELVRRGLLKRQALEKALAQSQERTHARPVELISHLDTEMWLRHWLNRQSVSGPLVSTLARPG